MRKLFIIIGLLLATLPIPANAAVAHTHSDAGFCSASSSGGNMSGTCVSPAASKTFTYTATATNEAVLFGVTCGGTVAPTVTLTATGWTLTALSAVTGSSSAGWIASFGAIAPNTSAATFTVTWSQACGSFMVDFEDEFSGNDTTGGTTTFDAHNSGSGTTGSCSITVTPANANDGLWGACADSVTAVGAGHAYTKGGDDTQGDWSEWFILSGGSGASQTVNFVGTSGFWTEVAATVKPAGAAAPSCNQSLSLLGVGCK